MSGQDAGEDAMVPIGYLWIMHDDTKHVMWCPIDGVADPKNYKEFKTLYDQSAVAQIAALRVEVAALKVDAELVEKVFTDNKTARHYFEQLKASHAATPRG